MELTELKTLLISAKNQLNNNLSLNKTKNVKFDQGKYFDVVSFLSIFGCCAEDGSKTMDFIDEVPSADSLLQQLKKLEFCDVETQFQELFYKQFFKMFPKVKKGKKYKANVILDAHEQETYSKEKRTHSNIRGGKHKNGTNFFFKYLTMQVLIKNKLITLGVKFYGRENQQAKLVDELIELAQNYVKIKVVLLDRGFRDVAILNNLEYRNVNFLMPMIKDKKGENCFEELGKKNFKATKFWLANAHKEFADVKLLLMRLNNGKEMGFYTTLPNTWLHTANHYLKLYKKRWNIETGYRLQNMFLPKTTSINKVIRMFYFCYACAMHNLWLIIRSTTKIGKTFTVLKMKIILVLFWITTHLPTSW